MEFDASQILVALVTGVCGYIVNKIERVREYQVDLKKDLNAAFQKIRELERMKNEPGNGKTSDESVVKATNRSVFGEDDSSRTKIGI